MLLMTETMQPRLFGLDFQLIADSCLMIIAIFVLFLFMSYFLWNPAKKYLEARKKEGLIKHLGFSFHSTADELDAILTQHPEMLPRSH